MANRAKSEALFDGLDSEISESSEVSHTQGVEAEQFEVLIERIKSSLGKLNSQETSLKEALGHYEEGMKDLKKAQEILEQAKIQYQEIKD